MARVDRRSVLAGVFGALALPVRGWAQGERRRVRFATDWVWQSNHAVWTLAQDRGFFARHGIEASVDRGFGSADNMTKLAAGSLDIALVDPNLLAKFNHENPQNQLTAVFIVYDAAPSAVIFLRSSGIKAIKDLEGKRLAVTEGDATRILFPIFARENGIDIAKINFMSVTPQLRDTMVLQRQADASLGFLTTAVFNMAASGIPRDQIGYFQYNKHGLNLYSLALVCRKDYAAQNSEAVRGFIRATLDGARAMLQDPAGAVTSLKRRDNLLNDQVELARNELMNEVSLLTPHVRAQGMSSVDRARFEKSTGQVAEAFGLPVRPRMEDVYTDKFLPPQAERMLM